MGVVYRGRDERLRRDVALKVLPAGLLSDDAARRKFRNEARALSQINHPNVATAYDFDTYDGIDFLVMEYVEGTSLDETVRAGALPHAEVTRIGRQLADGLAAAHAGGVLHRDLKPANLRINHEGRLKILDFGVAKLLKVNQSETTLTASEAAEIAGTIPYMAPEQIRGGPQDERTDIYAAGAVLYELMTGRRPFSAASGAELTSTILRDPPVPPRQIDPSIPASLETVAMKCLAKEASERYGSAGELAKHLGSIGGGASSARSRMWLAVGCLLLVALVGAAAALWHSGTRQPGGDGKPVALAVLPFQVLNAGPETAHLGIGIPDALITRLANIRQIRVRSTTAILQYEKQPVEPRAAANALVCDYLVTGTVQHTGERFRINVQLLRGSDGAAVWGKRFDPPASDLVGLQDAVSEEVVGSLRLQLGSEERERVYRRYTKNANAYNTYLKGRSELAGRREASIRFFDEALALDSNYALARAGKSIACALMRIGDAAPEETRKWEQCASNEARAALRQDPNLAEAHEAMAAVHRWSEFDWENTIRESDRALELNPSLYNPHRYRGDAFRHMGLLDLVDKELRAAHENNPGPNPEDATLDIATALWDGRYSDISHRGPHPYVAHALFYLGHGDLGVKMLQKMQQPTVAGRRFDAARAGMLAAMGRKEEAESLLKRIAGSTYRDHHLSYSLGVAFAQLGNSGEAIRRLQDAADSGFVCYPWYARDPLLKPLDGERDFDNLLARLRNDWEANKARFGSHARAPDHR